ncbi:DUF1444 family protein [Dyella sp. 2HG41-7]|uniref:DUF1444 family protein n=1 Tax=Dyella sp. 2HG41-7 TaxID=2883239 RepID=UPI001F1BC568|nr:DUF1444 family protein [Dyella sp. 2HG41-7]
MSGRGIGWLVLPACLALMMAVANVAFADVHDDPASVRDRATFGLAYADIANRLYPQLHFRFVAADFSVTFEGGGHSPHVTYLDNAYLAYRADPKDEEAIISHYVSAIVDVYKFENRSITENDWTSVLPAVKGKNWIDTSNRMTANARKPSVVLTRQLTDGLYEVYVIDTPEAMEFVSVSTLADMKLSRDQIHDLAVRNLSLLLPNMQIEREGDLFAVHLDTNYEASLILIFDRWKNRLNLHGDPVIAIPSRSELLVADGSSNAAIEHLRAKAFEDCQHASYPITPRLFRLHAGSLMALN